MPYTVPTSAQFKLRFPVYASESDERINSILLEASSSVDQSWVEADYQPAIMYLAAHLLATSGGDEDDETDDNGGSDGDGGIASESFGPLSVSYFQNGGSSGSSSSSWVSEYMSTVLLDRWRPSSRRPNIHNR